jgi:hypothetical protein
VVLGAGARLFGETSDKKPVRLVDNQAIDSGVAYLTYELVREASRAPYSAGVRNRGATRNAGR